MGEKADWVGTLVILLVHSIAPYRKQSDGWICLCSQTLGIFWAGADWQ